MEDLKRLFESDPRKLAIGSKVDMVQELIKMLYFNYILETEVRRLYVLKHRTNLSRREILLCHKTMPGDFGIITDMCSFPCTRSLSCRASCHRPMHPKAYRGYFLITISRKLSTGDCNCNQTLRMGQELSTPPAAADGGCRLKPHHYRDREPWTCLAGRRDSDYDIHWEPKPMKILLESKSLSQKADAPRSPHTTGRPSRYTSDDVPATTTSPFVKRELDVVGREQKQGRQEAGEVINGRCIISNRRRAGPDMETIGNPFAADGLAVYPADSTYTTISTKIGKVDKSDAAITTTTLNDRETIVHNTGGGAEESVKSRCRFRRGLGNTAVSNGGAIPDARTVWVRQQLAISDAHNLVAHSTCKEGGWSKTADDTDNSIPFSSTKNGEQPIGTARDRAREAQVTGVYKNVPSVARRRRDERGLAKGEKRSVASWPFETHHAVGRRTLPPW